MLWLVVWLGAAAQVLARPLHGEANPSAFNSDRAGNYSFRISVDRLEIQNVNFNVHLAVLLGGSAHHPPSVPPSYQPPREQHHKPGRPPVTTAALGPGDYGRYAAPFVLAYPLTPWTAGGWKGDAASGNSPPLAPPPAQQANGDLRPQDHSVPPPPQQYPPQSTPLQTITTTPPPLYPAFNTRPKELTTISPLYPDYVTRSEKLITTSPPQYPGLETHSATPETLQTL